MMENLKDKIETIIRETDSIVEMFYQQKTREAYNQLDLVLGEIMNIVEPLQIYQTENPRKELDMDGLLNAFKEALSAMEERDTILIADVLKYEIGEKLEKIVMQI